MKRNATAVWNGTLKEGKGSLTTQSGAMSQQSYSFNSRFGEDGQPGTNPEELIAAAHAGCFTMATSAMLTEAGFMPESLETKATLEMIMEEGKPVVKNIHLALQGNIPNITDKKFQEIALDAKKNCPISRMINVEITMEARLLAEQTA